ncbi:MAG: hypothetical protein AB7O39_11695 [Flavobacteriaceae bacterium]
MSKVQSLGEEMETRHGFLGVPSRTFDEGGRRQFIALLCEGLSPESRLCEIGAGCLRTAYWLIRFLEPRRYCGIEPFRDRVTWGLDTLFTGDMLADKQPRFDFNDTFDTSVFQERFDFFLAGSIWTHAAKHHIQTMLEGFRENALEDATFLASYLPARTFEEDYLGDVWVGTSHQSDTPGIVRHGLSWIERQCAERGLSVAQLPGRAFDGQFWLSIRRHDAAPRRERIVNPALAAGRRDRASTAAGA